ncbi:MAG: hypothetical protein QW703_02105 [Candidatus Aenigmatarchaeota archaeon]
MRACRMCGEPVLNFALRLQSHVCQRCYVERVFEILKEQNLALAKRLVQTLPPQTYEPAMNNGSEMTEFGICDECGEISDRLKKFNNKWICEDCREGKD